MGKNRSGKQGPGKKAVIGAVIIIIGCILLLTGLKGHIGPNIDAVSKLKAKGMVTEIVNQTIREEFSAGEYEENLFIVQKGKDEKIQMVQSNTRLINELVSGFASALQEKYNRIEPRDVRVSLGTLVGSKVLSQTGIYINVRVQPLSVSNWDFSTEFESRGINQTKYKVYITVESHVRILQPFSARNLKVKNKVLISEVVIVGDVPDSYVNVPKEDILDAIN